MDKFLSTDRHVKPELDNTLGVINRDETIQVLAHALADTNEVGRFNQHIIQFAFSALVRQLSLIAVRDALPDPQRIIDHDDAIRTIRRLGYAPAEDVGRGLSVQTKNPLP